MSKLDLAEAYKQILVRKENWGMIGCTLHGNEGQLTYYVHTVLPFGLRSSPYLLNKYIDALEFIMRGSGVT